jgi:SAM-dependent methyltransferase
MKLPIPFLSKSYHPKLQFTGTCDLTEFQARCKEHDFWYHSYYFDNGFEQRGDYDIAQNVDDYHLPDLNGKSVLDIGTGSGWFATYFEQQGAKVTTVDARGYCDFDCFGRDHYPDITTEKPRPDRYSPEGQPIYYSPVSKGFWIMKGILGLQAEYINARVYQICPELFGGRKFDLVFMGSVLMHLRDPIAALMGAHSVCRNQLIATTYMLPDIPGQAAPIMRMWEDAAGGISWWVPNRQCIEQWLKAAGFSEFSIDRTVTLTADKPYSDASGKSSGVSQIQQLIHAFV